ncbi:MAG TPA: carboxymuconolactone decarboxylase family protein [Microbacteriaceae bacterium]|nr:carboxymuconolactone decarboxylase family protein [Microbacteriaceae bacterium]
MSRQNRPYIDKTFPEAYQAAVRAAREARQAAADAGLDRAVVELVNVRVSQLNGCLTCLSTHTPAARSAGVPQEKLDLLPAWREGAAAFTGVEKAALRIAESLTVIDRAEDREALGAAAAEYLTTEQIAAVEWVTILINAFNRISIASGHPALPARA